MVTETEFKYLKACYRAACISFQRAQAGTVQRDLALDSANNIWRRLAQEVDLREIRLRSLINQGRDQ